MTINRVLLGILFASSTAAAADTVRQDASVLELKKEVHQLNRTLCQMMCENKYHACVMAQMQIDMQARIQAGAPRGPSRVEPPACWPFDCTDGSDQSAPSKTTNPTPNCKKLYDGCLAKCEAAARR